MLLLSADALCERVRDLNWLLGYTNVFTIHDVLLAFGVPVQGVRKILSDSKDKKISWPLYVMADIMKTKYSWISVYAL